MQWQRGRNLRDGVQLNVLGSGDNYVDRGVMGVSHWPDERRTATRGNYQVETRGKEEKVVVVVVEQTNVK
ncbi:hypothetical protein E2C01_023908 [Portunus trituberculatus]|uniref:Uncharacterized protein n=1 Tax=Portunus trituberculatus TaxID=210409 RepID=A0A5B7E949_PORTR|nr:hypothetical protein [Portunus trituberculatus]